MTYRSDLEIAQACEMKKITEIANIIGINEKYLEQYGNYKAKVDYRLLKDLADKPDGKLVLVDLNSGDIMQSLQAHKGSIWSVDVRRDGKGMVSGGSDHNICFWEISLH